MISDVLSPDVKNNTISRIELNYENGEIKNVHYGDILVKFDSIVDANKNDIPLISKGTTVEFKNQLLQDGDIIFADTAEDESVGKAIEIVNTQRISIVSGLHTIVYRPKIKFSPFFLGYCFNTNIYRQQLLPLMQGIKVLSLSRSNLSKTLFRFPVSLDEQAAIGNFFCVLDDTISLKKQQLDKTVNIKNTMLDKMFPKKGANVPEIRFEGFSKPWLVEKLGQTMDITSVKRIHQSDWTDNGIRFIRARDIVAAYNNEEVTDFLYISQEKYNEYSLLSGKVKKGNILVTGVGSIGVPMLIQDDRPIYFKDGNVIWFKNDYFDGDFLFYSFTGNIIQNYIRDVAGVGTVGTYTIDSGKKTPIYFPSDKQEQAAIGAFFRNLDNLIEAQRDELAKLQNIKKACLSKMFV